jgi:hypothetical protein
MATIEHRSEQPSWDCQTCGAPWPCPSAVERMLDLYQGRDREDLGQYLGKTYVRMAADLPDVASAILLWRLFGWVPRSTRAASPH